MEEIVHRKNAQYNQMKSPQGYIFLWFSKLLLLLFFFSAEPTSSPTITKVTVLNSTGVLLEWEPVPVESRYDIITQYTIHYKDVERENSKTTVVKAPASSATINGLRQKAEYLFQIQAATSKGSCPLSVPPKKAIRERKKAIHLIEKDGGWYICP